MRAALLAVALLLAACTAPTEPPAPSPSPSPTPSATAQPTEPGGTLDPCPTEEPTPLTALTLNIHGGSTKAGELDLQRVADELEIWDADVVMLQEVDRGRPRSDLVDQATWLADQLGLEAAYGPTRRMRPGRSGNAVLSRFPVVGSANTVLPREPGLYRRGALAVTVRVGDQEVDVISTHLDHVRPSARRAQASAVADLVVSSPRPVLLGGDLNTEPGFPPLRILVRAGLVDVFGAVGEGEGLTVPAYSPRRRIDYLLADPAFAPVEADVLGSAVSDHRAVRATVELLPPAC